VEPTRQNSRLSFVRRPLLLLVVVLVAFALALPVAASPEGSGENGETLAQESPIRMSARAGLAGFVDARRPIDLAVTIGADVLFIGSLEVRQGTSIVEIAVEVPAAGEKTYTVRLAPPVGSVQTRLRLFADGVTDPAATTNIQLRAPLDETVVAVSGPPELVATIDEAAVAVTGSEIIAAPIDSPGLETGPYPARYLVIDQPRALPTATRAWINSGGRVIVANDVAASLELELGNPIPAGAQSTHHVGSGLVITVPSLTAIDVDDWSKLINPTRIVVAPRDVWQSPDLQLMSAATSAGDQRIPGIPWLFAAVIGYAVLVGPVNFLVLRKFGRREFAWVTVPVLSLLAVAGFWLAGRERLQNTLVNHATVILANENEPQARSAVAVAAGAGGEKTVTVPSHWLAYPGSVNFEMMGGMPVASAIARTDGNGEFRFSLEQLGAAGVQGWWNPVAAQTPDISAELDGTELVVEVTNDTDLEYWAWGVVASGRAQVAPEPLTGGGTGRAEVVPGRSGANEFGTLGDAVIQARQLWNDPYIWSKLNLGYTADAMLEGSNTYFFGFTDEMTLPIQLDGRAVEVSGTTLIVVPIESAIGALGSATSNLLDTGEASWIDFGPGYLSLSTDEMTVGWNLPTSPQEDPRLEVSNMFGEVPRRLDAYNWATSSYDEVSAGDTLNLDLYRNAIGDVMVRARAFDDNDDPQFLELPMSPYAFTLEWSR
jgi:hypothetical protein